MNINVKKNESSSPIYSMTIQTLSYLKTSLFLFASFLVCTSSFAQDQFLWTGNTDTSWTDKGNWDYYPYGSSTKISPAPYYPGQGGMINPNGTRDDIAIFTDASNVNCSLNLDHTGTSGTIRIGGIIVNGYPGTITQVDGNRFNVSDGADAGGGTGFWDGTTQISSSHPDLTDETGTLAYRAHFDFDPPSNGFQGGATIVGGIVPSYSLLFAVPLTIADSSTFKAPKDETRIRHNATFVNGADFDNSHQGTVVLSNLSGGLGTRYYQFGNVHFWNLKVTPNGASPRRKEFSGGTCIVENDFMTTGLLGVLGAGSVPVIMNGAVGTEIHIKGDLIVGNVFNGPSYTSATAFGNIVLSMNGTAANQTIDHSLSSLNFTGNLPALRINKPSGIVTLVGPIPVNKSIEFVSGIVRPTTPSTQNALTEDVFVVNSNATVFGASDASFCEGAIRVRTGKTIELPVGKGSTYRPAIVRAVSGISPDNSTLNMYSGEYFAAAPITTSTPVEAGVLNQVSDCEVWAIRKNGMATTPDPWTFNLELSYNPSTDPNCTSFLYPAPSPCLVVSRWDHNTEWLSHGDDGDFVASNGDATVRSDNAFTFDDFKRSNNAGRPDLFTFGELEASLCPIDPCAVDVCVDYCVVGNEFTFTPNITYGVGSTFHSIDWDFGDDTSTVLNPSHTFTSPGIQTITVTVTAVAGTEICSTAYTFNVINNDCTLAPSMGITKKNIKEDKPDNATKQSSELNKMKTNKAAILEVSPNPSIGGNIQLSLVTNERGSFDYIVVNSLGQNVLRGTITGNEKTSINASELPAGAYIVSVQLADKKVTQQFTIVQ